MTAGECAARLRGTPAALSQPELFSDIREAESRSGCFVLRGTLTSQESFNRSLIGKGEVMQGGGEDRGEQERSVRR